MSTTTLKHIVVSEENFLALKRLGQAGDSFNDVISRLLKEGGCYPSHPVEFVDYYELDGYFRSRGAQINHRIIGENDFAKVTITVDKPIPKTYDIFYKKIDGKFRECDVHNIVRPEERKT